MCCVKAAAFLCFGFAGVAGLALVTLANTLPLLVVGALSVVAAWRYTGGDKPYGYTHIDRRWTSPPPAAGLLC